MKALSYKFQVEPELAPSLLHIGAQSIRVSIANEGVLPVPGHTLQLRLSPFLIDSLSIEVRPLAPGEKTVGETRINMAILNRAHLLGLMHHKDGETATVQLLREGILVAEQKVLLLPASGWMFERDPLALAGFVDGESPAVQEWIRPTCRKYLQRQLGVQSFNEALNRPRGKLGLKDEIERTRRIATAIYECLLESFGLHYEDAKLSMAPRWQKVRWTDEVLAEKQGTCIDLVLLTAACLEEAGLKPVIVMIDGGVGSLHVLAGCWVEDSQAPNVVVRDRTLLSRWIEEKLLLLWDPVGVTVEKAWPFSQAVDEADGFLSTGVSSNFHWFFDLARARTAGPDGPGISPMPLRIGSPLSGAAWKVVQKAEALALEHAFDLVERTHLLAGLLDLETELGKHLFGKDPSAWLTATIGRLRRTSPRIQGMRAPTWTRSAGEVLERAKALARDEGSGVVSPVELWWALLENPGDKAGAILALGPVETRRVCEKLKAIAQGDPQRDSYLQSRTHITDTKD